MAFRRTRVALWRFKRSPAQQDRAAMAATFAFIGLFAVGSVDAIITGGADFAPRSAYAAEYHPQRVEAPVVAPAPAVETASVEAASKTLPEVDYSFTNETLLGGPELELGVTPLFEDVMASGEKLDLSEPMAAIDAEETAF